MPAPIAVAPIAIKAAQWGAVAALAYAVARRRALRDARREAALDATPEGLTGDVTLNDQEARADAGFAWRRDIRLGKDGPGVSLDLSALARARILPLLRR